MTTKLIIADPDPLFYEEFKKEFKSKTQLVLVKSAADPEAVKSLVDKETPSILFLGPGWDKNLLPGLVADLNNEFANLNILVAVGKIDDLAQKLAEAGAREILIVPIEVSKLWFAIEGLIRNPTKRKRQPREAKQGKIITVFSTKGGVGKSVVTVNLAVALSEANQKEIIIMDLDLQFGDVGVMLQLSPKYTISDLLTSRDSIDAARLRSLLTEYSPRIKTLLAPLQPELADLVCPEVVEPTLNTLRELADYIVIDTPPSFNDNVLTVLDQSDFVLLVGAMDLPSIKNIKLCLQTMKLLGYPQEKVKLILNRVEKGVGLTVAEIESSLKTKISQTIPNDKLVLLSVNKGRPVLVEAPKSPASKSLADLTGIFTKKTESVLVTS